MPEDTTNENEVEGQRNNETGEEDPQGGPGPGQGPRRSRHLNRKVDQGTNDDEMRRVANAFAGMVLQQTHGTGVILHALALAACIIFAVLDAMDDEEFDYLPPPPDQIGNNKDFSIERILSFRLVAHPIRGSTGVSSAAKNHGSSRAT